MRGACVLQHRAGILRHAGHTGGCLAVLAVATGGAVVRTGGRCFGTLEGLCRRLKAVGEPARSSAVATAVPARASCSLALATEIHRLPYG